MTFVAAKRFGNRILMAADTMISDLTGSRHDVIPGRLKVVVIDPTTTVAFAGLPDQGVDAIKGARRLLSEGATISEVEQSLASTTGEYGDKLEFLIASHRDGVTLKRIWEGRISSGQSQACIGQRDLLSRLLEQETQANLSVVPYEFEAESPFMTAFRKLFRGTHVSNGVGGFGVLATCSPYGHSYNAFGGVTTWDTIELSKGVTQEQWADRRSGMIQWGYNINSPRLRGVGALGALIPDAGIAFIYAPFLQDEPIQWRFEKPTEQRQHVPILEAFQKQVDEVAQRVGGGIEVTFPPSSDRPPTESELERVFAHAAVAPLPTQVRLEADAVWIGCDTPEVKRQVPVHFNSLDPDPVWVLTTTIDRLNAEIIEQLRRAGIR